MVRYMLAALTLKIFSINGATKSLYRKIGNIVGQRKRQKANNDKYVRRGNQIIDLCNKYQAVNEGDSLLELGTGWMHWHSIYLRLHYDVNISMFDIWDNRQFEALQAYFSELNISITREHPHYDRISALLEKVLAANNFAELYASLDLDYVIEEKGRLTQFPDASFDCVFSSDVLEHIPETGADQVIKEINRILKPGGYSIHYIATTDHLAHYDSKMSCKNYLRYSDRTWKLFFENEVQYFNRFHRLRLLKLP